MDGGRVGEGRDCRWPKDLALLQRPKPIPWGGKRREGPAHTAGHIRAPREHQVFITGIPMKRLQGKNHTQEGKNNKVTHTDLQLSRRACAWPWSREGPDASGAQSSRPGLMVGGEASFSSGVTGLAGCRRGLPPQPRPAYVSKLGHSVCTALPSPGKLDRQKLRQLEVPFPTSP